MAAFFTENPFRKKEPPPSTAKVSLGRQSEEFAAQYLKDKGWVVIGKNLRFEVGEIDLFAFDPKRKRYVAVEVRSKRRESYRPSRTLSPIKIRRLKTLVKLLQLNRGYPVHLLFLEVFVGGRGTKVTEYPIENY